MLSGAIPTSLLVTPWRARPPFKGPNSKIVKATQLFQYSIGYPISLKIAALPLQGICVNVMGLFIHVFTAGTSLKGHLQELLQGLSPWSRVGTPKNTLSGA